MRMEVIERFKNGKIALEIKIKKCLIKIEIQSFYNLETNMCDFFLHIGELVLEKA